MKRFLTWFRQKMSGGDEPSVDLRRTGSRINPARPVPIQPQKTAAKQPEMINPSDDLAYSIEDGGPGKNVLKRNRLIREDTGTHDNLRILDVAFPQSDDEDGFDPYNTGRFDRTKSWNGRSLK